ncbi:hypothetical protein CY34DRAFT_14324 [Suillus luteus UH-Slu-Lm8-n1]|uniref:Uncharacterized protein n=1 Tax=Suillus luteus UH-Slu-Lm8-n1 TaxID=930992 RepID=A0A0D0B6Q4_9AGAM|nr:hypothetical protein CY34DRAFT_14324 [Suillus luteus UH-Slu-Lm8-n1]
MLTGVDAIQDGAKYVVGDQYTIAGSHVHAVKDRVEPVGAEGNSPCYFSSFWYGYMLTLDFFHHSSPIAIVHPSLSSPDTKHRSHCFTLLSLGVRVLLPHLGESRGLFAIARTASCPTEANLLPNDPTNAHAQTRTPPTPPPPSYPTTHQFSPTHASKSLPSHTNKSSLSVKTDDTTRHLLHALMSLEGTQIGCCLTPTGLRSAAVAVQSVHDESIEDVDIEPAHTPITLSCPQNDVFTKRPPMSTLPVPTPTTARVPSIVLLYEDDNNGEEEDLDELRS